MRKETDCSPARIFPISDSFTTWSKKGVSLDGAKQKLKENLKGVVNNHEIISRLESVKAELIKIKNQL